MYRENNYEHPNCPACGKENGATTSCTAWGHHISVCSETCAEVIRKRIDKNTNSPEYKAKVKQHRRLEKEIVALKYKGVNIKGQDLFEHMAAI